MNRLIKIFHHILFVLLSVQLNSLISAQSKESGLIKTLNSISSENISHHVKFLASDSLEGRGTGQPGGNLAAKYLESEFGKMGLKPTGDNNSYYQYIPMHSSNPLSSSQLVIYQSYNEIQLILGEDYLLFTSGEQTYLPMPVNMVFAGYGIHAPEFDYNDYHSINVEGKIVVFLEGEPESEEQDYFSGQAPSIYSLPESKQRLAFAKGAAGSILIPSEIYKDSLNWQTMKYQFAFEDVVLAYSVSSSFSIKINPNSAELLFNESGYSLDEIYEMHRSGRMKSFALESNLSFKGVFKERDFLSPNIIGMISGSDSKLTDSYLIVSAHYDHLGIGPAIDGDSIYNGALDNAIGMAVMLEIARSISEDEIKPARSIIFIATTGEEKGLLGSAYYVQNPVKPLYKTVANINIDGIALFKDFTSMVGVGSELSTLRNYLTTTLEKFELKISKIPDEFYQFDAFNRSDQLMFASAGIPSILVLEGPDNKHITYDDAIKGMIGYNIYNYHKPSDDLNNIVIDYEAARQHAEVLKELILSIANSDEEPEWNEGSAFINARLRSIAEKR